MPDLPGVDPTADLAVPVLGVQQVRARTVPAVLAGEVQGREEFLTERLRALPAQVRGRGDLRVLRVRQAGPRRDQPAHRHVRTQNISAGDPVRGGISAAGYCNHSPYIVPSAVRAGRQKDPRHYHFGRCRHLSRTVFAGGGLHAHLLWTRPQEEDSITPLT